LRNSKLATIGSILSLTLLVSVFFPALTQATISLAYNLTYNCPPEDERSLGWPNSGGQCIGLELSTTGGDGFGHYEAVTSLANYPGGGGSLGERHWIGPGKNRHTNPIDFFFTSSQPELYIRWYVRYESGTRINPSGGINPATGDNEPLYQKMLYFDSGGIDHILYMADSSWEVVNNGQNIASGGSGWEGLTRNPPINSPPSPLADQTWHCLEYHYKVVGGASNDIIQMWVDGVSQINRSNINFTLGNSSGMGRFGTTGNTQGMVGIPGSPGIGGYRHIFEDIDDWSMSATTRIGCLSGSGSQPPAAPANLRITP
jgi:hypothetical protein